jgi:hypothetical protein
MEMRRSIAPGLGTACGGSFFMRGAYSSSIRLTLARWS